MTATRPPRPVIALLSRLPGGVALCVLLAGSLAAQEPARPAVPLDSVAGILDAFTSHQVVALPGGFGASRQALLERLMRDRRFPGVVNDIVVEFGSSRYQDTMDRYIRGEDVAYQDLRHAWQDTTSPIGNDGPQVEDFYRTVREFNATLPEGRRVRVLLGEPPMDWEQVRAKRDHRKWVVIRDLYVGDLIRREVTARGRRALVLYGQLHYPRKEILTNYDMTSWQAHTLVSWLESMGVRVFNVWATGAAVVTVQPDAAKWPHMSLTLIRGTTLGAADFTAFDPGTGKDRFVIRGPDDFAPIASDQFRTMRMEDQFDAILYTGGGPPAPPLPQVSAKACADPGYLKMRSTRIAIAGLPPEDAARIEKACAGAR
jgi:hypothetical protein